MSVETGARDLVRRLLAGERRALARAMSLVEDGTRDGEAVLREIYLRTGGAHRVGITGPPGAGKSTLTERLALEARSRGVSVGILAVDPTSPFTGGALLGDRVRMAALAGDASVFIRSMATRGKLGGLAETSTELADLLDARGCGLVLLETVGVGQSELEVAQAADTTLVVLTPESGDGIQAMKAGLLEVGDVFVVNKADRPGADRLRRSLETTLSWRALPEGAWRPPVLAASAGRGEGIGEIVSAAAAHHDHLRGSGLGQAARHERWRGRVRSIVERRLARRLWDGGGAGHAWETLGPPGRVSPYDAADAVLARFGGPGGGAAELRTAG
ncbi:MAG: methylmalonyl Co-A mutase-associated GTPase MeaB [Gemmatimonadetes bacterium]|nr:methylmalonyl Co-A mutase-associated GTPase MeaB [Gemmatimonadota bacterium]